MSLMVHSIQWTGYKTLPKLFYHITEQGRVYEFWSCSDPVSCLLFFLIEWWPYYRGVPKERFGCASDYRKYSTAYLQEIFFTS